MPNESHKNDYEIGEHDERDLEDAPDIVETIADGHQPRSLTVRRLLKGIPNAWQDQRTLFGFTK
jgi:hypothetical protein